MPAELTDAVASYMRMSPAKYPQGRIVAISPEQTQAGALIKVEINPPNCGNQVVTAQITTPSIIEMLLRFCNENNIPIPRAGRKYTRVIAGAVALLIVIDPSIRVD